LKEQTVVALTGIVSATSFGAYCVYMGHNSTIISSVFLAIGTIVGYMFGKGKAT
jgi:hypothetical protein